MSDIPKMSPDRESQIIAEGFDAEFSGRTESEQPSIQEAVNNVTRRLHREERTTGLQSPTLTDAIQADLYDRRINI